MASTLTREDVARTVQAAIDDLPEDIQAALSLAPVVSEIRQTDEGDWVVPVTVVVSTAMERSQVLHRILSDIQDRVESKLRAFVSILLAA